MTTTQEPATGLLDTHELLLLDEAATVLRVSRRTVYRLIDAGDLATIRVGEHQRIRTSDVRALLAGPVTR